MSVPPSWTEPKVTTIKALQATPAELTSGNRIGQMSVPPSWTEPKVTTIKALQATPLTTLPTDEVPASGIPGMPGMAMTGTGRGGVAPRYGVRLTVMPRPFSGG
ncbi:hypothetical protein VIMS_02571 [Mycobacterium marinum]|uniref:PE/PPE C-terminal domain-containing protein n=1 Tax=Mycobacterium marinum TaxID=1781 RepID=UPI000ECF275C|nr:PE/PPE C-terminal domain-containing protein [Mycobacterium marinum]RFZ14857.1 hypothetical protein VIMS_02571 [Mycobacterium marinum]